MSPLNSVLSSTLDLGASRSLVSPDESKGRTTRLSSSLSSPASIHAASSQADSSTERTMTSLRQERLSPIFSKCPSLAQTSSRSSPRNCGTGATHLHSPTHLSLFFTSPLVSPRKTKVTYTLSRSDSLKPEVLVQSCWLIEQDTFSSLWCPTCWMSTAPGQRAPSIRQFGSPSFSDAAPSISYVPTIKNISPLTTSRPSSTLRTERSMESRLCLRCTSKVFHI